MVQTLAKLGVQDAGIPLGRKEFAEAEFEPPYRYERVGGKLLVMAPAGSEHRQPLRPFVRDICTYWHLHKDLVDFVDVQAWTSVSEDTDRIPDLGVYLAGPASGTDVPERVPDLAFEFVSQGRADRERDYIHKRSEYHAIGVRQYVIVDRYERQVLVLIWTQTGYTQQRLGPDEHYTTPLLPGLDTPLGEAFQGA